MAQSGIGKGGGGWEQHWCKFCLLAKQPTIVNQPNKKGNKTILYDGKAMQWMLH